MLQYSRLLFRKKARNVLPVLLLASLIGSTAAAAPDKGAEPAGKETNKEPRNAISVGGAYMVQVERETESPGGGRNPQSLGGFVIRYQRELIPSHLAIAVSKPFYFARGRFDSPFEVSLKGILRRGPWDWFLGPMITWNIRLFDQEAADRVGETNKMSFGLGAVIGGGYSFTLHWGLELEALYEYVPKGDVIDHEISTVLHGVYRF